jgi:hypothetical protein
MQESKIFIKNIGILHIVTLTSSNPWEKGMGTQISCCVVNIRYTYLHTFQQVILRSWWK